MTPTRARFKGKPNGPAIQEPISPPAQQQANGHAVRAEWDDPEDTGRRNSTHARAVHGFRRADPLITLHKRDPKEITEQHLRAAERLRDDWEMGQGVMRRSGAGNGDVGIITAQMAAAQRYRSAVKAVGPRLFSVLELIVLHGWTVAQWAEKFGLSEHKSKGYLIAAMDCLHDHYNPPVQKGLDTNAGNVAGMSHPTGGAPGQDRTPT